WQAQDRGPGARQDARFPCGAGHPRAVFRRARFVSAIPDAEVLLPKLAAELKARVTPATAMIGLHTGGAWLAERLHPLLGLKDPLGLMDIAFYRDDYAKEGLKHDP